MKYSIRTVLGLFCMVVVFSACHEDMIEEVVITDEYTPYTIFEVEIIGLISDQDGNPVPDAQLQFDGQSKRADELGYFTFGEVNTNNQSAFLTISAPGYIPVQRLLTVLSPSTINLNIILTPIPDAQSFDSDTGKEVIVSDDARVTFYPDGIVSQNSSYKGEVFIRTYHLAKDDPELFQKLPGDLIGIDSEQELQILDTYGMLYLTMEDEQGNELQHGPQTKALLSIDIPDEFVSIAPSEIPLWFFDSARGVWIEDGVAQKNGNTYEGTVTHFTWWNIDIPYGKLVTVCLEIEDLSTGVQLANQDILFSSQEVYFGIQRTNNEGKLCLNLPEDVEIKLQLSTDCEFNSEALIGPFYENQTEVKVELGTNEAETIKLTGTVTDCNRDGIRSNIDIADEGSYLYSIVCPNQGEQLSFLVYDVNNEKAIRSDFVIDPTQSENTFDLQVCDEVENLVVGNLLGQSVALTIDDIQLNPNETILILENSCYLSFLGNSTGTFEGVYYCSTSEFEKITVTIESFGSIIRGSFTSDNSTGSFSVNN